MAQKKLNGNIIKWIAFILAVTLAISGWVYSLGVQGEKLKANIRLDNKDHPLIYENREQIIKFESDIEYIKAGVDRIEKKL